MRRESDLVRFRELKASLQLYEYISLANVVTLLESHIFTYSVTHSAGILGMMRFRA